jgi:hypothetical protein
MAAPNPARDVEALTYRAQGWNYDRIAAQMGYANRSGAQKAVERAIATSVRESADEAKTLILADLFEAKRHAWEVLGRRHVHVSNGHVVRRFVGIERDDDGIERLDMDGKPIPVFEEVEDDGPVLAAIDRITRIDQEIAKILGAYAPEKHEHEHRTIGEIDARLIQLADEMAAVEPGGPEAVPRPS